jgi:hypothetical protein
MGIISILLFSAGYLGSEFYVPFWVILSAHTAIGLGTLAGGWRIVKTMGMRLTKLRPIGGFCAEAAGAVMLIGTAVGGIPVSTTHTITGSIMGVGATQRLAAVRWGVAGEIVWAWALTIPLSALIAAAVWGATALILARLGARRAPRRPAGGALGLCCLPVRWLLAHLLRAVPAGRRLGIFSGSSRAAGRGARQPRRASVRDAGRARRLGAGLQHVG